MTKLGVLPVIGAVLLAGCSSSSPAVRVSVLHDQKSVSYGGISIVVPSSWPVDKRSDTVCGIQGPGVLVGPPPPQSAYDQSCPGIFPTGVVVRFGGPDQVVPVGRETHKTMHGVSVVVSDAIIGSGGRNGVTQWLWEEVVRFPGHSVWLMLEAPGTSTGVPTAIDEVVGTVRPAG